MVRGIERFREHFREHGEDYVLIGGAAADAWFSRAGLPFRATKDLDIVLLLEALDDAFLNRMWDFVRAAGYARRERSYSHRAYYRFAKPGDAAFPAMIELFSRAPESITVPDDQQIVLIPPEEDASSLSAILMDEDYYRLVVANREEVDGLPCVKPECLILLKACAWGDLSDRQARGEHVDARDIRKHRNDVFRLAVLLNEDERMTVPERVCDHLHRLLDAFPADSPDWNAIEQSVQFGGAWPGRAAVIGVLRSAFRPK